MVQCNGLNHIGIIVPDVEAAAAWYVEKGGFAQKGDFIADGSRAVFVQNSQAGVMLELIQRPEGHEQALQAAQGAFVDHVAYQVEDINRTLEEAKACGMDIIEGVCQVPTFWENGFAYVLVRAAGGEKVEYGKTL